MNLKELKELIEFLIEKDIAEFELERGDVKVRIKRAGEHPVVHVQSEPRFFAAPAAAANVALGVVPVVAAAGAPAARKEAPPEEVLERVKSPIVVTLYEALSPVDPPFVKVRDTVKLGQWLCMVASM